MKSPAVWEKVKMGVNVMWTVGERLRVAYNTSKSEAERSVDKRETVLRAVGFVTACAIFVMLDAYEGASLAAVAIARGVLASGPRGEAPAMDTSSAVPAS